MLNLRENLIFYLIKSHSPTVCVQYTVGKVRVSAKLTYILGIKVTAYDPPFSFSVLYTYVCITKMKRDISVFIGPKSDRYNDY